MDDLEFYKMVEEERGLPPYLTEAEADEIQSEWDEYWLEELDKRLQKGELE